MDIKIHTNTRTHKKIITESFDERPEKNCIVEVSRNKWQWQNTSQSHQMEMVWEWLGIARNSEMKKSFFMRFYCPIFLKWRLFCLVYVTCIWSSSIYLFRICLFSAKSIANTSNVRYTSMIIWHADWWQYMCTMHIVTETVPYQNKRTMCLNGWIVRRKHFFLNNWIVAARHSDAVNVWSKTNSEQNDTFLVWMYMCVSERPSVKRCITYIWRRKWAITKRKKFR